MAEVMCEACFDGDHANCGMQTWCECECPGPDGFYCEPVADDATWCSFCKKAHAGGDTCMGHHP